MKNNYNLKIESAQTIEGESFDMSLEMNASYIKINGTRYISYIQTDENSGERLRTTLKIKPNGTVTIIKDKGGNMVLEVGKAHPCNYSTPFGTIYLETAASEIENGLDDSGGKLRLRYSLAVDGNELSKNVLSLTVKAGSLE